MVSQALLERPTRQNTRLDLDKIITQNQAFINSQDFKTHQLTPEIEILTSSDDLIEMMKLRSEVFDPIPNFKKEFPDGQLGLNFDKFDKYSVNLGYKQDGKITGTVRIIMDSELGLQSEEVYNPIIGFNKLRQHHKSNGKSICELSRLAVDPKARARKTFEQILGASGLHAIENNIGTQLSSMAQKTYQLLLSKVGMTILKDIPNHGKINIPCYILDWSPANFTDHYKNRFQKGMLK